jgi:hypothetical protein
MSNFISTPTTPLHGVVNGDDTILHDILVIRVEEGYPEQSLLKLATDTDVRALNF